ncbi:succinylglutamate desuccinylase/aspartoacylase family protein [Limnochorda pilosa]|uniref:Succinylglutamate desuccinylase n=1 Tax=Limnochorda pilosa TaxID=1555112 RepID=A0A0K2SGQ3_LIMPI|nr:succinylglutamate desuccinylase/aspartoacylase family protein [Limnochorda pilosa]BAS26291.1 succinylglutamate desuccinylase [Limnochorda pilosa]
MRRGVALFVAVIALVALSSGTFRSMERADVIVPGPGVTATARLSDYFAPLAGSPGETPVYVLDSGNPGGTVVILGGTHADELAGKLAAVLVVENAVARQGRLLVIPEANASASTHTLPLEGHPQRVFIPLPDGSERTFKLGSRVTNPLHQWPDPIVYVHAASGQELAGSDARNLNRNYPGRPDGSLTEQVAYAIQQLVVQEEADLVIDLHEASPEYPVINTIVAHPRAMDLAAWVALEVQMEGMSLGLEPSPESLRGLIHRELGDQTSALVVLMESANPAQGRLRGKTDADLVLEGQDPNYVKAARIGRLYVPFDEGGHPLSERVARHITGLQSFLRNLGLFGEDQEVVVEGLPSYAELAGSDLGRFLQGAEPTEH